MRNVLRIILLCLVSFFVSSCLSTPETPAETAPVAAESAVQPSSTDVVVTESSVTEPAVTELPAESVPGETAVISEEPALPEITEPTENEIEIPSVTDSEPSLPASERLLYFYPEPDPLYVVPVAPVAPEPAVDVVTPKAEEKTAAKKAETKKTPETKKAAAEKPQTEEKPLAEEQKAEVLPGIWESEPVAPAVEPVKSGRTVNPSRQVALSEGQNLEVWYPGSGWVYLGDVSAQNGLAYENRKLDKNDTLFSFKALKAGNYVLEFTRFDVLEDTFASDTLAVSVAESPGKKTGKIRAPDYRSASAEVSLASDSAFAETVPVPATASASSPTSAVTDEPSLVSAPKVSSVAAASTGPDPASLLESAKKNLASGDAVSALASLEKFFSLAVDSLDEGWFLRGQAYEANSPARDIRKALAAYQTLVSAWPESSRWLEADTRIRYLNQFYLGR